MFTIRGKEFKGYSSKSDELWDNPGLLSEAVGLIVNKGSLTNVPQPIVSTTVPHNYVPFIYNIAGERFIITIGFNGNIRAYNSNGELVVQIGESLLNKEFGNYIDADKNLVVPFTSNWMRANALQVGEWLYIYTDVGRGELTPFVIGDDFFSFPKSFGRMIKVKLRLGATNIPISIDFPPTLEVRIVSIPAIYKLTRTFVNDDGAGKHAWSNDDAAFSGYNKASFAFTMVESRFSNVFDLVGSDNAGTLGRAIGEELIESIAFPDPLLDELIPANQVIKFTFTVPDELRTLLFPIIPVNTSGSIGVGIYVKTPNESLYRFYRYVEVDEGSIDANDPDDVTFTVTIPSESSKIINLVSSFKTAPLTEQFPMYPGYHGVFYKNNVYASARQNTYHEDSISGLVKDRTIDGNYLQVSRDYDIEFRQHPSNVGAVPVAQRAAYKVANYRDDLLSAYIGNLSQPITGLIEYFGQLYIFKQESTWLLTNDIEIGQLREQWPKIGCVGVTGGRAYVVGGTRLYWASSDAIWMYDGSHPVKISELIEEDLRKIDTVRYNHLRLGWDEDRELLIVCFPVVPGGFFGVIPPFICSVDDNFAWTKGDSSRQLNDVLSQAGDVYYFYSDTIELMGRVETIKIQTKRLQIPTPPGTLKGWSLTTGVLSGGDESRLKHWKDFFLQGVGGDASISSFSRVNVEIIDPDTSEIRSSFPLGDFNDRTHIGVFANDIKIRLIGTYINHFRINGFKVTGNMRGRK